MQNVLEFDYQFAYEMYLIDQEYEERLQSYIYNSIINEDYIIEGNRIDAFKEFVAKIIESIKNAFSKFVAKIKDLFSKDEDYFKKYKNVIESVSPLKANISNFYEYDIEKIKNSKLPKMDLEQIRKLGDSEIEFIKKYFPDFVPSNGQKFTDKVKEVFRGGEAKTVDASTLAIKPMEDFRRGYEKLTNEMNKDIFMIEDAGNIVKLKFKMMKNSGATPVKKEKINDSFSFEDTMMYYFNEDGEQQSSSTTPQIQPTDNQDKSKQKSVSATAKKVDPSSTNDGNSEDKFDQNKFEAEEREREAQEAQQNAEDEKAAKIYFNVCSQFLGMRFAMAQEVYKTYCKIIKWHVDQWVKEHDGDRSGKVKKSKPEKEKVTKDTKFYYTDEKGDWFEVTPSSDKDARAMADPNYEYKADDGKTYKLYREIKKDSSKSDEKDKYKTNPVKVYLVDDEGYSALNKGKPKYYIANTKQKYADWFAPGARFKYGDRSDWKASLKPGKIPKNEEENKK